MLELLLVPASGILIGVFMYLKSEQNNRNNQAIFNCWDPEIYQQASDSLNQTVDEEIQDFKEESHLSKIIFPIAPLEDNDATIKHEWFEISIPNNITANESLIVAPTEQINSVIIENPIADLTSSSTRYVFNTVGMQSALLFDVQLGGSKTTVSINSDHTVGKLLESQINLSNTEFANLSNVELKNQIQQSNLALKTVLGAWARLEGEANDRLRTQMQDLRYQWGVIARDFNEEVSTSEPKSDVHYAVGVIPLDDTEVVPFDFSSLDDSNIAQKLAELKFDVRDKRQREGALWVIDCQEFRDLVPQLSENGFRFIFARNGSRTTERRPSWFFFRAPTRNQRSRLNQVNAAEILNQRDQYKFFLNEREVQIRSMVFTDDGDVWMVNVQSGLANIRLSPFDLEISPI